ncbi:cell division protein FtsX [Acidocella aminolytica]|jgi:cell division transport system permease protein|nr:cell division protein FtsX [Acidocella aminolytica]SHE87547.1 cell division transport system permease protein [Acidocella aminolytica 101 = DSM 11237]
MMAKRRGDLLGVRAALSDRLLPVLVGAMSFLAALALGGALASATLAASWQGDTASALTIQVPQPTAQDAAHHGTRLAAVQQALAASKNVADVHVLSEAQINRLIAPWLGSDAASLGLSLPAIITGQWTGPGGTDQLTAELQQVSPGALLKTGALWAQRVAALTTSLQACALAVLLIVALVAAAVVAVATRSGLAQLRETIETVHGLGALDADIAARFAARATWLALAGSIGGTVLALPVLGWLAWLAAPFTGGSQFNHLFSLPPALLALVPLLPGCSALIGWATAQITVRGWLRRLP